MDRHSLTQAEPEPDGKWQLRRLASGPIAWTDQQYTEAFNALPVGTAITRSTTVALAGLPVPVPIGNLVHSLRKGRIGAPSPALITAMKRHGLVQNQTK